MYSQINLICESKEEKERGKEGSVVANDDRR